MNGETLPVVDKLKVNWWLLDVMIHPHTCANLTYGDKVYVPDLRLGFVYGQMGRCG
jgi:hypothetical protein